VTAGLRKSIGATDPEIFGQFLIESVSLSLVGGLIGSALGYGVTLLEGTSPVVLSAGVATVTAPVLLANALDVHEGLWVVSGCLVRRRERPVA